MRILNNGPLPGLFTSRVSAPEQIYLRCKAAMNCHGYQISEGSRTDSVSWCWVRVSDKTNLVTDGRTTQLYELIVLHYAPSHSLSFSFSFFPSTFAVFSRCLPLSHSLFFPLPLSFIISLLFQHIYFSSSSLSFLSLTPFLPLSSIISTVHVMIEII